MVYFWSVCCLSKMGIAQQIGGPPRAKNPDPQQYEYFGVSYHYTVPSYFSARSLPKVYFSEQYLTYGTGTHRTNKEKNLLLPTGLQYVTYNKNKLEQFYDFFLQYYSMIYSRLPYRTVRYGKYVLFFITAMGRPLRRTIM